MLPLTQQASHDRPILSVIASYSTVTVAMARASLTIESFTTTSTHSAIVPVH